MRIIPVALTTLTLLVLAACERPPTAGGGTPAAPAATPGGGSTAASGAPAPPPGIAAPVKPAPGATKTFGDWAVGCDNVRLCTMASLGPDGGDFPPVTMAVLRQPGPGGAFDLSFAALENDRPVTPVAATVDGRRVALPRLNGAPADTLARAMANGRSLVLLDGRDRPMARLSLAGASAALRWIDAQQGRAGTVTAAVATGPGAADTIPPAAPAPVIRAVAATGTAATPTAAQLAEMRKRADCDPDSAIAKEAPEVHALGGGATLVMLPCSTGAYNLSSALFVLKDGRVTVAPTDAPTGFGPTPADGLDAVTSVVNGSWKDGELTSYAKGRGLGDCGVSQTLVWDGTRFRLSEQAEMGECRGNPNYITTWRAQVVRG